MSKPGLSRIAPEGLQPSGRFLPTASTSDGTALSSWIQLGLVLRGQLSHHTKVHAGELILSGDAEGQVEFRDASGQRIGSSLPPATGDRANRPLGGVPSDELCAATRAGASVAGGMASDELCAATRAGSSSDALDERIDGDGPDPSCARVLAVMGNRGGWTVDRLVEATGLSVQIVLWTKCLLEFPGLGEAFVD